MTPLVLAALVLVAADCLLVLLIVFRRLSLAVEARKFASARDRMRPVAILLTEGEPVELGRVQQTEAAALASILSSYGRTLSGAARSHITEFFESGGYVDDELSALRSRRAWRRAKAAFALGDMHSQKAVQPLILTLRDRAPEVRNAATRSLGVLAAEEAVPELIEILINRSVPRSLAARALFGIGPAALPNLIELSSQDEAVVRATAIELIGLLGEAGDAPSVETRLKDPAAAVRANAAAALGRLGAGEAVAALRDLLRDRIPFVRTAAAQALGAICDPSSFDALLEHTENEPYDTAQAAAWSLAKVDAKRLVEVARNSKPSPQVVEAADIAVALQ